MMRRWLRPVSAVVTIFVILLLSSGVVSAATFNKNRIIDDSVFNNTNAMTAAEINSFLNKYPNSCISTNHGFSAPDPTGYNPSQGYLFSTNSVSAGKVIYDSAKAWGLNPQVLLATLQKEQSLVQGDAGCTTRRYATAMGYGCPDGGKSYNYSNVNLYSINGVKVTSINGTCVNSIKKVGFSQQVIRAAWLLKFAQQRSEGNVNWAVINGSWDNSDDPQSCYSGPMTQGTWRRCPSGPSVYYDGYSSIDGQAVHKDNGSTAALYWYTPHLSGNQHFFSIFTNWFGSTYAGPLIEQGDDGSPQQYLVVNGRKYWITNMATKTAWGLTRFPVNTVYAGYLQSLPSGANISSQFARDSSSGAIYIVDSGNKYHIYSSAQYANWGSPAYVNLPPEVLATTIHSWGLPNAVSPVGSSTVYMIDGGTMRAFSSTDMFKAWEGDAPVMSMSSTLFSTYTAGTSITSAKFTIGGKHYLADAGTRHNIGSLNNLYTMSEMSVSPTAFVNYWAEDAIHPFIKTGSSSAIYMVDGGQLHHVASTAIMAAWAVGGDRNITTLKHTSTLATIPTSSVGIDSYIATDGTSTYLVDGAMYKVGNASQQLGATNAASAVTVSPNLRSDYTQATLAENVKATGTDPVYLLLAGQKSRYLNPYDFRLWDGPAGGITSLDAYVVDSLFPSTATPLSVLFTDGTNDYVMSDYSKYYQATSTQVALYGLASHGKPTLPSWLIAKFTNSGSFSERTISGNGVYYFAANGKVYQTTNVNLATLWGINTATVRLGADFVKELPSGPLSPFVFVPSDGRILIQNHDSLWHITNIYNAYNLGYKGVLVSVPLSQLSIAAPTTNEYRLPLIKNASSTYYLVDNSVVRGFTDNTTQTQWVGTDNGIPVISPQLMTYLGQSGTVTKSVKVNGTNTIYAGVSGQLRWIKSSATYWDNYAPYTAVSPQLVRAFPRGADL